MAQVIDAPFIRSGDPDTSEETTLYAPGELGGVINFGGKVYQKVRVHDAEAEAKAKKAEKEEKEKKEKEAKETKGDKAEKGDAKAEPKKSEPLRPALKTEPTPTLGARIAAGQVAYWQDKNNYVVTNDRNFGNVSDV